MSYDVAILIERQLEDLDADQLVSLHEGLDDQEVVYHLLLPVESSADLLISSMGALGSGQEMPPIEPETVAEVEREIRVSGQAELDASADLLRARGKEVTAQLTDEDPIDDLERLVKDTNAAEAIILTEPHVVREFLQIDWSARAKRKLDVPTLHLLEHEPFDAQR